jgi:hypothetical protein
MWMSWFIWKRSGLVSAKVAEGTRRIAKIQKAGSGKNRVMKGS